MANSRENKEEDETTQTQSVHGETLEQVSREE